MRCTNGRTITAFLTSIIITGAGVFPVAAADTLIAHWSFDAYDSLKYLDATKNGIGAYMNKITLADGVSGKALELNDATTDVTIPQARNFFNLEQFTIEVWVYSYVSLYNWRSNADEFKPIFEFASVGIENQPVKAGYNFELSDYGGLYFGMAIDTGTPPATASRWIQLKTDLVLMPEHWNHVAMTFDNKNIRLYINGQLEKDTSVSKVAYIPQQNEARIGSLVRTVDSVGLSEFVRSRFKGKIDELKIFGNALTPETIAAHFRQFSVQEFKGLLMHISFSKSTSVKLRNRTLFRLDDVTGHSFPVIDTLPFDLRKGVADSALYLSTEGPLLQIDNSFRNFDLPSFSIDCWVAAHSDAISGVGAAVFSNSIIDTAGLAVDGFSLTIDSTRYFEFGMADTTENWHVCTSITRMVPSRWYHVAMVYDGDSMHLYIDGIRENSRLQRAGYRYPYMPILLGCQAYEYFDSTSLSLYADAPFNGTIDEFKLFNYPRTLQEVQESFRSVFRTAVKPLTNLGIKPAIAASGTEVNVPVCCANRSALPIENLSFDIVYDPSMLEFQNFSCTGALENAWCPKTAMVFPPGKISFATGEKTGILQYGEGDLFTAVFKVAAGIASETRIPLNIVNIALNGSSANLFSRIQNGWITVSTDHLQMGDVNGNGQVDPDDARKILRHLVGVAENGPVNFHKEIADVNGNGAVSSLDAAEILQYSMALRPVFSTLANSPVQMVSSHAGGTFLRQLRLVANNISGKESVWSLSGDALAGLGAAEFTFACIPAAGLEVNAVISTALPGALMESYYDPSQQKLRIALITNDFVDRNDTVELLRITTPPAGVGGQNGTGFVLEQALLNDGSIPTGLENGVGIGALKPVPGIRTQPKILCTGNSLIIKKNGIGEAVVRIYSVNGRVAMHRVVAGRTGIISLKKLSRGMYLYCVSENGIFTRGKLLLGR